MKVGKSIKKNYLVHSLERGLDLIEVLGKEQSQKSLTELSQIANFNLATTYRIINALVKRGYIKRNISTAKFSLGFKFFELGEKSLRGLNLREEAIPILKNLAQEPGESAYLQIIDNDEALFLERIDGSPDIKILLGHKGGRLPLHMGAGPRVLLAFLPEQEVDRIIETKGLPAKTKYTITNARVLKENLEKIRQQGYALSIEDVVENIGAVGCPVWNWKREVVAAISLSGFLIHFQGKSLFKSIEKVKLAAENLSREISVSL